MASLIPDEPVCVVRPAPALADLGEPAGGEPEREEVRCVVCPGPTADLDATRPNGVSVAYTLHFPKTYAADLRGCSVEVRGAAYDVVGDPQRTAAAAMSEGGYEYEGHEVKDFQGKLARGRVVRTKTDQARYSEAKRKTLSKALGSAKG